jgi:hypothetical protein
MFTSVLLQHRLHYVLPFLVRLHVQLCDVGDGVKVAMVVMMVMIGMVVIVVMVVVVMIVMMVVSVVLMVLDIKLNNGGASDGHHGSGDVIIMMHDLIDGGGNGECDTGSFNS